MKLLRSITRRGFNVGTAGWFTVLKPNTWFPASRLTAGDYHRATLPVDKTYAGDLASIVPPKITIPKPEERSSFSFAVVVVAAVSITSAMLWWIMHP